MKTLLLHLTDSHFKNNNFNISETVTSMVKSISKIEKFDNLYIFYTGDISHSCNSVEYSIAKEFLRILCENIDRKFKLFNKPNVYIIPGNHDIDFNDKKMDREMVKSMIVDNKIEKLTNDYLSKMTNFFDFAYEYSCFLTDKFIDYKTIRLSERSLGIVLINSALFSLYKDNDDNDNGLHIIPALNLKKLDSYKKCDLNVMLIHHAPKFFEEKIQTKITNFISYNIDFIFYGHEHVNQKQEVVINGNKIEQNRCGGPFFDNGVSKFNTILIDDFKWTFSSYTHTFMNNYYDVREDNNAFKKLSFNNNIDLNFYKRMESMDNIFVGAKIEDIFVFPELLIEKTEYSSIESIKSMLSLRKEIFKKKITFIKGGMGSGKTTLSKYLFLDFSYGYYPLILNPSDFHTSKIDVIIENAFRNQYDYVNYHYGVFKQLDSEHRILIIDDFHKLQADLANNVMDYFKSYFNRIILMSSKVSEFDVLEKAKKDIEYTSSVTELSIIDFYKEKRLELIRNIIIYDKNSYDRLVNVENLIEGINNVISNQLNIMTLSPEFITLLTKSFISNGFQSGGNGVFNSIFISNITNMIKSDASLDISSTLLLLQIISYEIHIRKEYPIKQSTIMEIIDDYNKKAKKGRQPINPIAWINKIVGIRIFKYANSNHDIAIVSNNYLAYFVAKDIVRRYVENQSEAFQIDKIITNLCFGINADILLFICYIVDNKNILSNILLKAQEFFDNKVEMSFDDSNVKFLETEKLIEKKHFNLEKEKEDSLNSIHKQEQSISDSKKYVLDIYDYDESKVNDTISVLTKSYKFIEIIAKILPDFLHLLDDNTIDQIVDGIYRYPNILLYSALKPIDIIKSLNKNEFDSIMNTPDVKEYSNQETLINEMTKISRLLVLNIYNMAAKLSSKESTVTALDNYDYRRNSNHLLFNAMVHDNLKHTKLMGEKLEEIDKKNKEKPYIKNMIASIIRKHLVYNKLSRVGYTQHLVDKYLQDNKLKSIDYLKNRKR